MFFTARVMAVSSRMITRILSEVSSEVTPVVSEIFLPRACEAPAPPFAEKALLDMIYLRKAIPFRDELDLALPDRRRLNLLAKNFPGPTGKLVRELIFAVLNPLS